MEAKLWISGMGLGIPRTAFSANLASGAYLLVRPSPTAPPSKCYGLVENFSLGSEGSTVLYGHAATSWFPVLDTSAKEILNAGAFKGRELEISVTGTFIGTGRVDIKAFLIDDTGEPTTLLEKYNIHAEGGQLSSTSIRGRVRELPTQHLESKKAS